MKIVSLLISVTVFLFVGVSFADSLLLHYSFEGSVADPCMLAVDSSANSYDGIITGAPVGSTEVPAELSGGNSWYSDGGDWMDPDVVDPGLQPTNYSIAYWSKPTALGTKVIVCSDTGTGTTAQNGTSIYQRSDKALRLYHNGVKIIDNPLVIDTTKWTHVAVTVDTVADQAVLYVDGVFRVSVGTTLAPMAAGFARLCSSKPGGDYLSYDDYVGYLDDFRIYDYVLSESEVSTLAAGGAPDADPPTPNPAAFASAPAAVSDTEITMAATTGADATGPVEYFFDETSGNPGGTDSGWTTNPVYNDTGLSPSTQYTYTVQMRDSVTPTPNVGTASAPANATTNADTVAPTPDPMTWATVPYATGETSISMTATTASDPSGVEYYFTCTAGGGHDSGWQDSTTYEDTLLTPGTQYTYTVTARDKSANQNTTAASTVESATTQVADTVAPTPDPMTWAAVPYATGSISISMTATTASDPSGVEYYFTCTAGGGHDSGWQDSGAYTDTGLTPDTQYTYTVKARDKSLNQNMTADSNAASVTTDAVPPGLLLRYNFNGSVEDPCMVAADSSANGYDGIITGNPVGSTNVPVFLGVGDSSYWENDWMDPDVDTSLLKPTNYTIAFWTKATVAGTKVIVCSPTPSGTTAQDGTSVYTRSNAGLRLYHNGLKIIDDTETGVVFDQTKWTHVAVTVDTDTDQVALYVDGVQRVNKGVSLAPMTVGFGRICSSEVDGEYLSYDDYNGYLDDLRIYDYALTPEEVKALGSFPLLYYSFEGSVADPYMLAADSSGNDYDGIITGNPAGSADVPVELSGGNSWYGSEDDWMDPYLADPNLLKPTNYTIAFWAKPESHAARVIVCTPSVGYASNGTALYTRTGGYLRFYHNGLQVITEAESGVVFDTTEWTHVAVTVDTDADQIALYVNGIERLSKTTTLATVADGFARLFSSMAEGRDPTSDEYKGYLDDFYLFNFAMTPDQVLALTGKTAFVLQPPDGTKIPRVMGASGNPVALTGFDLFDWFGISHHRTWLRLAISDYPDDSSVNTLSAFDAATAAIRQDPWRQATQSDYYIDWNNFYSEYDLEIADYMQRLTELGIETMICNTVFVDDTASITSDWVKTFKYWKSWYSMVYYMASIHDVTMYEFKNEPVAQVDYDTWESHWLVAADAMRKAMEDVNADYGKNLPIYICGHTQPGPYWDYNLPDPYADPHGWGSVSWAKVKYDMYGSYNVNNPWNYGMYDYHRYTDSGGYFENEIRTTRIDIANALNDPSPDIPLLITEFNSSTGAGYVGMNKDSEDLHYSVSLAQLLQVTGSLGAAGLGDDGGIFQFKIGHAEAGVSEGIRNCVRYTSPNPPYNCGGATRSGVCFQMYASHFRDGKLITPFTIINDDNNDEHRVIAAIDTVKDQYYIYGSNTSGTETEVVFDLNALDVSVGSLITVQLLDAYNTGQITETIDVDASKRLIFSVPDLTCYLITVPKGSAALNRTILDPIDDTMQNVADTVIHGTETTMQVSNDHDTPSNRRAAFIRFNVNNVDTMSRALLRLSGRNIGTDQSLREILHVYAVADETWNEESSMSWTTAPGVGLYHIDSTTMGSADGLGDMIDIEDNYGGYSSGVGKGLGVYGHIIGPVSFYSNAYQTYYLDVTDYLKSVASGSTADVTFVIPRIVRYNVNMFDNPYYYDLGVYHYDGRIVEIASKENDTASLRPALVVMGGSGGNGAPSFTTDPINELDATEDSAYSSTIADNASDPESDPMTFTKVTGPAWLNVAANGDLSGTPDNSDVGLNVFTVEVSATGGSDIATLNITVINTNDAPAFTVDPINASDATENTAYNDTIAGTATDVDAGDTLTYSKVSGPAWLSVASDGTLSGTPAAGDVGANSWTVQVSDGNGGTDTASLNITVAPAPNPPAAPSSLSATAIATTQIDISWTDNANNETGFKIERSESDNSNFVQIATVGADVTSYSDTTVRKGTTYYYRVRATNADGDSAYSNEASATTPKK